MTRLEWLLLGLILLGLVLISWVRGWPQAVDPWTDRLDAIERQLDQLLQDEERRPASTPKTPRPIRRPRARPERATAEPFVSELPRLDPVPESLPPDPPPRPCCQQTWEAIDQRRSMPWDTTGD